MLICTSLLLRSNTVKLPAFFLRFQTKERVLRAKIESVYVSAMECLTVKGQNETKSNVNKNMNRYLLRKKKGVSSVDEKMTKKYQ